MAGLLVLALGACGAVYAYDRGRDDLIADGVSAGGVPLGGLRASAARARLDRDLVARLDRPVVVRHRDRRFRLTAREARLGVDVAGMVSEAVRRSREGSILQRTRRALADEPVPGDVAPRITYSTRAVGRLVRRVQVAVQRPARDADVSFSRAAVTPRPSQDGRRLRSAELRRAVERRLVALQGSRRLRARTERVRPAVTTEQLAERYPAIVVVDRARFRLRLFRDLRLTETYKVAVGQVGLETPSGLYRVQNKAIEPDWQVPDRDWAGKLRGKLIPGGTPENPLKARWLGIYDGAGIHGTDAKASLGTRASHGCIRMDIPDVKELYEQVPVQAPVFIA